MQNKLSVETNKKAQRYYLIDALRGFSVFNMVIFHLLYDIFQMYGVNTGWYFNPLTAAWERFICVSFIIISGISFNFSHRPYRRGIMLNIFGFIVTIVTAAAVPNEAIWFGILNFLGCAMLILQPLKVYFEKTTPILGMFISMLCFALTYGVPKRFIGIFNLKLFELPDSLYSFKALAFLGFPSPDFRSTDFFPLIPWIFLFFFGYFLWRFIKSVKADKFFVFKIPVLDIVGRYSLWIYLAHQPVILAVLMIVFGLG
ncbi:MAG: DUF1624 domain-containing protein [Clostridiales bacterium]|nr:DUF1624 domain-containing protein [Clostridiales bacterium]